MKLQEFRQQYPQYNDMDDQTLAKSLHQRHYADVPFEQFSSQIGLVSQDRSYMDRVVNEAAPAVANMGGDILRSIPAGIRGAGEAIVTGSMERGLEGFESSMDTLRKHTPTFGGERVQAAEQALGEGIEQVVTGVGNVAEDAALWWAQAGHEQKLPPGTASPGVRTGAEVALNFLPIPGAGLVSRIPKIGSRARAASAAAKEAATNAQMVKEAEELSIKLESEKQANFANNATQPELPGFQEQRLRSPYKLPEDLQQQLEAELNPPVEQRQMGQRELFSDVPEVPDRLLETRPDNTPLDYTPVEGGTTPEGRMALGIGEEALRPGAGPEQLRMQGLDYPGSKPRVKGPVAEEKPFQGVYKDERFERRMDEDEANFKASVDAMNERQKFRDEFFDRQRREAAEDAAKTTPLGGVGKKGFRQGGAVKLPGGMWHPEAMERLSDALAPKLYDAMRDPNYHGPRRTPEEQADWQVRADHRHPPHLKPWSDKAIRNYLNRYAGTERDPLKDVEIPMRGDTTSWGDLWDRSIHKRQAGLYGRPLSGEIVGLETPEFPNVPVDEPIYNMRSNVLNRGHGPTDRIIAESEAAIISYLSHVGDYLRQNVKPEKLKDYDLVRAVKETAANDKRVAKEMEKAQAAFTKDLPVYKEYPDGYKWVELKLPEKLTEEQGKTIRKVDESEVGGKKIAYQPVDAQGKPIRNAYTGETARGGTPEEAYLSGRLAEEGNIMGHCVGGYCEGVASGESRIFSLRDPKGGSHVTVEVQPERDIDIRGGGRQVTREEMISQIKGKQNRAPEAKYLPYVQDFVQSKNWGEVRDLANAGLKNKADVIRTANQQGNTAILDLLDTEYKHQQYVPQEVYNAIFSPTESKLLGGTGRRGFGQGGAITPFADFKKDLKARKINIPDEAAKAIWEKQNEKAPKQTSGLPSDASIKVASNIDGLKQIQQQYADRRTFDEIKEVVKAMPADTLTDKAGLNTIGKIVNGRFISKDNPLLSWVSSQIHWTKQGAISQANAKLHGKSRKSPDEGTYNYIWQQLSRKERIAVNDVGQALNNAEADINIQHKAREVLGRELTDKELQAYNDRVRINKEVLADVNAFLKTEGREPIGELPHYWSPAVFDGPFRVRFLNKAGETVKVEGFYTKPDQAKLQKAVGDEYKVEVMPDQGLRGDMDWEQFEWLLRQLSKEQRDPAAQAIREAMRRQGFGKHGLKRKGVKGALGTEGGVTGLRRYEETSERYIRQAYDYLANRQLDKIHKDVLGMDEANHVPYTKAYAVESIDVARGGSNEMFETFSRQLSAAVSGTIAFGTGGKLVLPQRFTRDLLRYGNKVKTTLLLGFFHPVHIGAQILQTPTFMPPKLMAMAAESGLEPVTTTMKAMAKGLAEYAKWNDSVDSQKLQAVGAFDATFKYDWSTYAGDANPQYKKHLADTLTGIEFLSGLESHAVRRPAAHMFLAMLRELGYEKVAKDKNEIYQVAREMTDHYMVSNRHYEKSHMFSRTGLVGMAISPLQSFSTTWLGMLREFTKLSSEGIVDLRGPKANGRTLGVPEISLAEFIKQGGSKESYVNSVKQGLYKQFPLAAFLAANLLTAGMLGVVGIKEWDAMAHLINKFFGYNVPSGTEYILSKYKSDKVRFGVLSDLLGIHVGATFNSPTLTGSVAPGVQALGDAANMGWQGLKATGLLGEENKPTEVEMRDAKKGVSPRFSIIPGLNWGDIEKQHTRPGAPYQESSGAAGPYTRDKNDEMARRFGTYTNKEAKAKTEFYTAKKKMTSRQAKFGKTMNRAVDIILSNPQSSKELEGMWKKLGDQGFSGNDIREGLVREIKSQMVEADVRGQGKLQSTRQQQLALLLRQLGSQ